MDTTVDIVGTGGTVEVTGAAMPKCKQAVVCGICENTIKNAQNLKRHFDDVHENSAPFTKGQRQLTAFFGKYLKNRRVNRQRLAKESYS